MIGKDNSDIIKKAGLLIDSASNKKFTLYKTSQEISEAVTTMSDLINEKYAQSFKWADKRNVEGRMEANDLYVIGILNGSVRFMMDVLNQVKCSYFYDFMKISSYKGMKRNKINLDLDINKNSIKNKNVLLIEDIVDSGNTIRYIKEHFKKCNIKSLTVLSLFVRTESKKEVDWFSYEIKNNKYIIGYGMDCNNLFRNLNDIYIEYNEKEKK